MILPQVLRAPPEPKLASLLDAGPGVLGKGEEGVVRGGNDAALHSALGLASDLLVKLNVVPPTLFPVSCSPMGRVARKDATERCRRRRRRACALHRH